MSNFIKPQIKDDVEIEDNKETNNTKLIVLALVVFIILIVLGIFLLYSPIFTTKKTANSNSIQQQKTPTEREIKIQELGEAAELLVNDTLNVIIDDNLIAELKRNPSMAMDGELKNVEFEKDLPDLNNLSTEQAKIGYKLFLSNLSNRVADVALADNMQFATGRILEEALYLAKISGSDFVSPQSKPSWTKVIKDTENLATVLSYFAVNQKEEFQLYIADFYDKEEFKKLGI